MSVLSTEHSSLNRQQVVAGLVLVVIAWAVTWPASQLALHYLPPLLLNGVRCVLSGTLLTLLAIARGLRPWGWRVAWVSLVAGLLNVGMALSAQIFAIDYLSGGLASLLVYVQPMFLVLLAHAVRRERIRTWQWGTVTAGFAGVALITFGAASQHASWLGILLAVVSAVSWAGGVVFLRQVSDAEVRGAGIISLVTGPQFLVGGAAILAVGLATERWPAAGDAGPGFAWMLALTIGTAAGWLAYLLLLERGVSPERLGGWSFGVPLTANAIGLVALGERASFSMVAGGLLVLASVAAVERFETRSPPPAAAGTVVSS